MSYPSRHVADVMAWAERYGCEYAGAAKSGHARINLPTGEVYTTASTPSDVNATRAAIRDIARKLGVSADSGRRAGKFRGRPSRGFSMRAAVAEKRPDRSGRFETASVPVPTPLDHAIAKATERRNELVARMEREPYPYVAQELRRVEQELRTLKEMRGTSA